MDINRRAYSLAAVVKSYAAGDALSPAEELIFSKYRDRLAGKSVLDLGCGAGRTTTALAGLSASYHGVDFAEPMIRQCRERFAGISHARFHVLDAASMPTFADRSFDFVLFSYNGIDYVDHAHRHAILREVRRVLRADGIFAFSTHNRHYAGIERRPRPPRSLSPLAWASFARNMAHSLRNRRLEIACAEYETINDSAEGFRLLAYYSTAKSTAAQLGAAGFRLLESLDDEGRSIPPTGDHPTVPYIHFVAAPR